MLSLNQIFLNIQMEIKDGLEEFQSFLALHRVQLESSAVPEVRTLMPAAYLLSFNFSRLLMGWL